jgi:hypothetical protein
MLLTITISDLILCHLTSGIDIYLVYDYQALVDSLLLLVSCLICDRLLLRDPDPYGITFIALYAYPITLAFIPIFVVYDIRAKVALQVIK